jgi:hypothetical protein
LRRLLLRGYHFDAQQLGSPTGLFRAALYGCGFLRPDKRAHELALHVRRDYVHIDALRR